MKRFSFYILMLVVCCSSFPAFADGGYSYSYDVMTGGESADDAMADQRALIWETPDELRMIVQSSYRGAPVDFAWLLPLPAEPTTIELTSPDFLPILDELTKTWFVTIEHHTDYPDDPYYDGDLEDGEDVLTGGEATDVTVLMEGELGLLDYAVISGDVSTSLITWLEENGYAVPEGIEPILAEYSAEDFVFFVAKFSAEAQNEEAVALPAITFFFEPDVSKLFPMRITRLATRQPLNVQLFTASYKTLLAPDPESAYRWVPLPYDIGNVNSYQAFRSWLSEQEGPGVFLGEFRGGASDIFPYGDPAWGGSNKRSNYYCSDTGRSVDPQADEDSIYPDPANPCWFDLPEASPELLELFGGLYHIGRFATLLHPEQMIDDVRLMHEGLTATGQIRYSPFDGIMEKWESSPEAFSHDCEDGLGARSCLGSRMIGVCYADGLLPISDCGINERCTNGYCTCEADTRVCGADGRTLLQCEDGEWVEIRSCEFSCYSDYCTECKSGDKICDGDTYKICGYPGRWSENYCEDDEICVADQCFLPCTAGDPPFCALNDPLTMFRCDGMLYHEQVCGQRHGTRFACFENECNRLPDCDSKEMMCVRREYGAFEARCNGDSWDLGKFCSNEECDNGLCRKPCYSEEGNVGCTKLEWPESRYAETRCTGGLVTIFRLCTEGETCRYGKGCGVWGNDDQPDGGSDDDDDSSQPSNPFEGTPYEDASPVVAGTPEESGDDTANCSSTAASAYLLLTLLILTVGYRKQKQGLA